MVDWIMYGKVQEKKRKGLNKSQTARDLGVDYKTILKYWDMTPEEYAATKTADDKTSTSKNNRITSGKSARRWIISPLKISNHNF